MYKHSHVGVIEQVQPSRIDSFDQMGGPRSEPSHIQNKWLLILQRLQLGPPVLSSNATLRLTIGNRPTACVLFNINGADPEFGIGVIDRKSTRLNSSHVAISYAVFCLKKKRRDTHDAHERQIAQV